MGDYKIYPHKLKGDIKIPPSKSIAHRAVICAALSDGISRLTNIDYSDDIIEALTYLTKKKGEYYPDYIERIINSYNKLALEVKLADLTHNIDINRIKDPSVNDYERVTKRYIPAYNKILNKLDSMKKEK